MKVHHRKWVAEFNDAHPGCTWQQAFDASPKEPSWEWFWVNELPANEPALLKLAESGSGVWVRETAVARIPWDHASKFISDPDSAVREAVARRLWPRDRELLATARADADAHVRYKALWNTCVFDDEVLLAAARSEDERTRLIAVEHAHTYSPVMDLLVSDPVSAIYSIARAAVAWRIPLAKAEDMARSKNYRDRWDACEHLPPGHPLRLELARDPHASVRQGLVKHSPVDAPELAILAEDPLIDDPSWIRVVGSLTTPPPPPPEEWRMSDRFLLKMAYRSRINGWVR